MLAASSFLFAAVMAWVLYALGTRLVGSIGLMLSLLGLWTLAAIPAPLPQFTSEGGGNYVSVATDKDYHRPGCPLLEQKLYFATRHDAEGFGRTPCECVKLAGYRINAPHMPPTMTARTMSPMPAKK